MREVAILDSDNSKRLIQKSAFWLVALGTTLWPRGLSAAGESIFPTKLGTRWDYQMTQEFGSGVHPAGDAKPDADGKVRTPLKIFIARGEKIDGVDTLRWEMHRQGAVQLTEFLVVKKGAVTVMARSPAGGEIYKLSPPELVLKLPPKVEEMWDYQGKAGEMATEQHFAILAQEDVEVPAGRFSAFHLRISQDGIPKVNEDRWFAPGVGFVKMVTLMTQPKTDRLIQRITLELLEKPKNGARPAVTNAPPASETRLLHGALATSADGEPTMTFKGDVKEIFARWQGDALRKNDKIRCVITAERKPKAIAAEAVALEATDSGMFTFGPPGRSWPQGKYRAEFYVGDELTDTVRFTIGK